MFGSLRLLFHKDCFGIHVPILDKNQKSDPKVALELQRWCQNGGFWVGVTNTRNALIAFLKFR